MYKSFIQHKNIYLFLFIISFFSTRLNAQLSNGIFFQAVAKDNFSNPAKNRKIYIQSTILQNSVNGKVVLIESHQTNSDIDGVFSISIGNGSRIGGSASNLSSIDWSNGTFYLNIKIAVTPTFNNNWDYTKEWIELGTTSFGIVPFAIHANTTNKLALAKNINGVAFDGTSDITIQAIADAATLTGTRLNPTITGSSLTSVGTLESGSIPYSLLSGTVPIWNQNTTGNAATATLANSATKLAVAKNINGVAFDGTTDITVTADAATLTGTRLNPAINGSSLTSVGTLVSGSIPYSLLSGTVPIWNQNTTGNAATATLANSATKLAVAKNINGVAFDGTTDITVTADAATLTGTRLNPTITGSSLTSVGTLLSGSIPYSLLSGTVPIWNQNTTGNAATATLAKNATTAAFAGTASSTNKLTTPVNINGVPFDGTADITVTADAGTLSGNTLTNTIINSSLTTVGTITSGTWSGTTISIANGGTGLTKAGTGGQVLTSTESGTLTWTGTHYIGEKYGGGIVFFVYDGGKHGLIAALSDQTSSRWHAGLDRTTRAKADGIGAGLKNTSIIIAVQTGIYSPTYDGNAFAATVCNEYFVTENGVTYGDWYLPSKYELNLLYIQKNIVGNLTENGYWSSTEYNTASVWGQSFWNGLKYAASKFNISSIRAIRSF